MIDREETLRVEPRGESVRLGWILGCGVAAAVSFELLGRMSYQFFQAPYGFTGVLTLLAILSWGGVSIFVIRRLRTAPWIMRTVFIGAASLALSQIINLTVHFNLPFFAAILTDPFPLQPVLEEGLFVLGLAFLFTGFYLSLFESHHANARLEREKAALAAEAAARKRVQHALEQSEDALRGLNADLEDRVQERTAELQEEVLLRKEADLSLRKSEEKYRTLVQNANSIILRWRRNGDILFLNEYGQSFFGFSEEDLFSRKVVGALVADTEDTGRDLAALMEDIFAHPEAHERSINQNIRKDGQRVWVAWTNKAILDDGGRAVEMLSIGQDVTDRKKAEEERERLQDQLLQAQKMESVGRLAGGVAHDFNNMLGIILGRAELALEHADLSPSTRAAFKGIQSAAERSAALTRQLLAFARKQTAAPTVLHLNEAVSGMIGMLKQLIGEDMEFVWRPGESLWPVKMDASQLDQALANLCVNARDAAVGTGRIVVETSNVVLDDPYCTGHAGCLPGDYVMIAVSDNGRGMDKETQAHIFEPFFTTKGLGQGVGLGLSTVYGLVKQNRGFIQVYSELGQGACFKIYLPRHMGAVARQEAALDEAAPAPGHGTILVVEDEPEFLDLAGMMLEKLGYCVLLANSPSEALRLAGEHVGEINLLMTDVVMPEMNGRDLANQLLSLCPNLKRLFMSGYTANVIAHRGVLEEGVHFIQKPFSLKELAAKVLTALEDE